MKLFRAGLWLSVAWGVEVAGFEKTRTWLGG
jgi:hypothetical protein